MYIVEGNHPILRYINAHIYRWDVVVFTVNDLLRMGYDVTVYTVEA